MGGRPSHLVRPAWYLWIGRSGVSISVSELASALRQADFRISQMGICSEFGGGMFADIDADVGCCRPLSLLRPGTDVKLPYLCDHVHVLMHTC